MQTTYRGRRAASIENEHLRVTVVEAVATWPRSWTSARGESAVDAALGVDRARAYDPHATPNTAAPSNRACLAGIMGHNLCLDIFGGPSDAEARAGMPVHGEVSIADFDISSASDAIVMRASLPLPGSRIERRIELEGRAVWIRETVQNPGGIDQPVGWTEHVRSVRRSCRRGGPSSAHRSRDPRVFESAFGARTTSCTGAEFGWPHAPRIGGTADLRRFTDAAAVERLYRSPDGSGHSNAFFVAFSPEARLAFGYVWRRTDFPWLGIWEENLSRASAAWNRTRSRAGWSSASRLSRRPDGR